MSVTKLIVLGSSIAFPVVCQDNGQCVFSFSFRMLQVTAHLVKPRLGRHLRSEDRMADDSLA